MDNFEEQFLEQLAKARARLEGKEAYDDEAITKEFDPDADVEYSSAKKEPVAKPKKAEKPTHKNEPSPTPVQEKVKKAEPTNNAVEKKSISSEKLALIWGVASVAISLSLSCLGFLVNSTSFAWQAFEAYMPFIGMVCGASSIICGALLIKNDKKGTAPILLGLLAILATIFLSSL